MLARSIALASANAHASGLAHRVKFSIRDVRDPQLIGRYDLVTAFECLHDMSQPAALKAMRQLAAPAGVALSRARAAQEASGAREVRPREARSAPSADRCIRVKGDALSQFAGCRYISLETYRRNGTPVRTPVWFVEQDRELVFYTMAASGKAKRMRQNRRVRVAPCDARGNVKGEWAEGSARSLQDEGARQADRMLDDKYGWQRSLIRLLTRLRRRPRAAYAIRLA